MCFDKTGTLTEDGLDLYGIKPNDENFKKVYKDCKSMLNNASENKLDIYDNIVQVMSCCHSLAWVKEELIGDPLEIKMFNATDSELRDEVVIVNGQESHILKRFEFSSKLQRMSVLVRKEGKYYGYVKGSPEKIRSLCSSVPSNFHKVLDMHAQQGYRILALAYRELDVISQDRDLVEKNLTFLGFLIMENKLKPITEEIIEQLHEARIRSIMVTGDNVLTAISVARQCNLIHPRQRVYLGELSEKKLLNGLYKIQWKDFDHNQSILDPNSLEPADESFKETVGKKLFLYRTSLFAVAGELLLARRTTSEPVRGH